MNKGIKFSLIVLLVIFLAASCTNKKNPVGTSGEEGPIPTETEITADMFTDFYSFEDSIRTYNSDNLLVGRYDSNNFQNNAASLIKFTSLVDSFYQITNVRLDLRIRDNHDFDITTLKVGKIISSNWFETTATWLAPTDSTSWYTDGAFSFTEGEDIEILYGLDMALIGDSLSIRLPNDILENWILADTLNYGLALFCEEDNKFVEFYSAEYSDEDSPRLYFDYQETEEDTLVTNYRTPGNDILIYEKDDVYQIFENKLIASNIQPIKMLTRFAIPESIFTSVDTFTISFDEFYMQRLTINRAELILTFDCANPYPLDGTISLDPYLMVSDSTAWNLTDPSLPMLNSEDYEDPYISSTSDSLNSAAFAVNITKIIQDMVSGEKDNYGIMIRSLYENHDFRHTEFFYDENDLTNTKNPRIEIIFTPPYFGE
ncbi:MAG: hypothetical protein Q7J16_06540 [Candidatus Cloacimonadales bacterium]|nr:hypothetical protein [Candidatus Cloacimonadales bacterium]